MARKSSRVVFVAALVVQKAAAGLRHQRGRKKRPIRQNPGKPTAGPPKEPIEHEGPHLKGVGAARSKERPLSTPPPPSQNVYRRGAEAELRAPGGHTCAGGTNRPRAYLQGDLRSAGPGRGKIEAVDTGAALCIYRTSSPLFGNGGAD
ncbi:hypothetical protein SKAU_G00143660 [Synaphobranchus kaupii]|uniref:Secreted protein n=1 Tax=Synaphobranchus kaupii TaxID=118154 RepID=A0A9Q1FTN9_SYNKA|nr:hypothetical protein SKAU_G00143660 [Synaphobranchus kaupii]